MMSTSKNSFSVSAPVGFTYAYASSEVDGLHRPSTLPNSNIGDAQPVFPNMDNPISHTENTLSTLPNVGFQMFNIGNIPPASPKMGSPMLNITNAVSYGGVMLPNRETPMLNIVNGVSYGGVMFPNMETPMFDKTNGVPRGSVTLPKMKTPMFDITNGVPCNGVMLPNMETPMFDITNRVTHGGASFGNMGTSMSNIINGVPYGSIPLFDLKTPIFHITNSVPHGLRVPHGLSAANATSNSVPHGLSVANASSNSVPYGPSVANPSSNGPSVANANTNEHHTFKTRGRPLGSKNKPRGENSAFSSIILNVPAGNDLVHWVVAFAKSKKVYITIQGGGMAVSEAHISFSGPPAPPQIFKEHLTLLTFSGAHMYSSAKQGSPTYFNATLSREDGIIIGGAAYKIITMGEVVLSANQFKNPELLTVTTELR